MPLEARVIPRLPDKLRPPLERGAHLADSMDAVVGGMHRGDPRSLSASSRTARAECGRVFAQWLLGAIATPAWRRMRQIDSTPNRPLYRSM